MGPSRTIDFGRDGQRPGTDTGIARTGAKRRRSGCEFDPFLVVA